jgi:glycosyltransferase involved in cell wall biosynthesis
MIDIGINASRNRAGGAKVHLVGILNGGDPRAHGINKVHIWSFEELLDTLPDTNWLIKHNPPELERSLIHQLWWEYSSLPKEARRTGCDVLLNTDAGSVCRFQPSVVMSRDMLSYEKGEMSRYGYSLGRVRLIVLKYLQSRSMRRADWVIFLTKYAASTVQETTGKIDHITVISHGIGEDFRQTTAGGVWSKEVGAKIQCLYVSNVLPYKHQWNVIRAIDILRERGHNVSLLLAGGGAGRAQQRVKEEMARIDPHGEFVDQTDFVEHHNIPKLLAAADVFVFASSCENMPNTLLEAMASGLPIASSSRGPMPEVLDDGGVYFDPESPKSISTAIEQIVTDEKLRTSIAARAKELSERFSWERCASETWNCLNQTVREYNK